MSKLLVPTDFSDSCLPTMNYGIELANALEIGVLLFYYLDISLYNANYYDIDLGGVTSNINEFKSFKQMVYTTDYTEADLSLLERLVKLASKFNATVTALHIMEDKSFHEQLKQKGFEDMVREHCKYNRINFFSMEGEGTIEKVDDFADRVNADLLVMLQENRGFLERLFSKRTTQRFFF